MRPATFMLLSIASCLDVAEAQEVDLLEPHSIPPEFLAQTTRSPSALAEISNNTPCLVPCGVSDITPTLLQKCVDLCEETGHCCGNRLINDSIRGSAAQRMSCAFGCEIAYHSTKVNQCKSSCTDGQGGCEYIHPYIRRPFEKCGNCRAGCNGWPSEQACNKGCEFAATLDEFYKFKEPSDTCNSTQVPRFLFGGQSNMEGNSGQAMADQLAKIVKYINSKKLKTKQKKRKLFTVINQTDAAEVEASKNMRHKVWRMKAQLKKGIFNPSSKKYAAMCSFTNPSSMNKLDCERPVTPDACNSNGHGPELMFAHYFPILNTKYKKQDIGITKVAVGGTTISQWMKQNSNDDNNYWNDLADAILGSSGTMEGFVWFQGENDHFLDDDETAKYQERLTQFVSDVRKEIHQTSSKFQSKEDIPVVIVEVGEWIRSMGGTGDGSIIGAQRAYVESDPNAILVSSGSSEDPSQRLSKFYHFDHASQLIIGHRVAKALATLVKDN